MRRSFVWSLAAAVVASVAVLWSGNEAPKLIAAVEPRASGWAQLPDSVGAARDQSLEAAAPLPAELPEFTLRAAKRDVFMPKAAADPAPVIVTNPQVAEPPPPSPAPPPLNLRFMGSMVDPSGKRLVYLARGDTAVPVGMGDRLDDGYVVESLKQDAIVLVYPPMNARATIPIPPEPQR